MVTHHDEQIQKVIKNQQIQVDKLSDEIHNNSSILKKRIEESENLLNQLGVTLPDKTVLAHHHETPICVKRDWCKIQEEAEQNITFDIALSDILIESDIANVDYRINKYREIFDSEHKLDLLDWSISGVAGLLAALVDIFLVKIPSSAGLGGGQATEGGCLSNFIREKLKNMYSPDEIKILEKEFSVPYDASTSQKLFSVC